MILETKLLLSNAQALTSTADSSILNLYDAEYGTGTPIWLNVKVGTALDSTEEDATLTVTLKSCATESGSYTEHYSTPAIPEASVDAAGDWILRIPLPVGMLEFCKLTYTVAVHNFTSGTVYAWLSKATDSI